MNTGCLSISSFLNFKNTQRFFHQKQTVHINVHLCYCCYTCIAEEQEEEAKQGEAGGRRKKRTKRPEQAIYRPGQLRFSKREKDVSNQEERASSLPPEEENWESEITASRGVYGTTDEESSRGSKENSVDKDVGGGGGGKDTSRFTPSPSLSRRKEKGEGGRRRSKRPAMQIYVPKGRLQEQEFHRYDEEEGEDRAVDSYQDASPLDTVDMNSRFESMQVKDQDVASSTLAEEENTPVPRPQPSATPDLSDSQQGQTPPTQRRDRRVRGDRNRTRQQSGDGGWAEQRDHHSDKGCNIDRRRDREQHGGQRDNPSWSDRDNRGRGRHSEDRDPNFREQRGGRGRGNPDRDSFRDHRPGYGRGQDERDTAFKEQRAGRGRGRNRHIQYNRSSSSESLTKSVDLGHRTQWPAERMPQHSGTFPRSKAAKKRNLASDSKEDGDSGQGQGGGKYTFSSMRPPRERSGSISSDTSGGSDLSWEDLEAEYEREKPDWNTQVHSYGIYFPI